jgi:hypothetical protein
MVAVSAAKSARMDEDHSNCYCWYFGLA